MGSMVQALNPGGGEMFHTCPVQTGPGAQPSPNKMGTGSFLGVKQPGCGVDHPFPSSIKVKERVQLYFYSPSGLPWSVLE